MVARIQGLPALPGITPSRGTPTVAQANPSAGDAMASAFDSVARSAQEINRQLQPYFDQQAQERAMEDVEASTVEGDAAGRVITPGLRTALTRQDQIYNQTVTQLVHARGMNDAREAFETMRRDYAYEPEQFDAAVRAWRDAYMEGLDTPFRVELEQAIDRMSLDYGLAVQDERRMRDAGEALEQSTLRRDAILDEIFRLGEAGEVDGERFAELNAEYQDILDGLAANPLIDFNQADVARAIEALEATQEYGLARGELGRFIARGDYEGALDRIPEMSRELGYGAEEGAEFERALSSWVDSERTQADRIDAERRRNESVRQGQRYYEMATALISGDGGFTFDDIDRAVERGEISQGQGLSLYNQVASASRREADLASAYGEIVANGGRGNPNNREHREVADAAYVGRLAELEAQSTPELLAAPGAQGGVSSADRQAVAVSIANEIGIVPPSYSDSMTAMLHSNDPAVAMVAMESIGALTEAAGYAAEQAFDGDTIDQARTYRALVAGGMSPETAMADILAVRDPENRQVVEIRQGRVRDLLDPEEGGISIQNEVQRLFGVEPTERGLDQATSFYQRTFESAYVNGASVAHAQARARTAMERVYGVSEVSGRRQVMAYPPEKFPGNQVGSDNFWMRVQLADAIMEQEGREFESVEGGTFGFVGGRRVEIPNAGAGDFERAVNDVVSSVQLIPDAQTAREYQSGVSPTYSVVYENQDGVMQRLVGRFYFDPTAEIAALGEQATALLEERRAAAEQRIAEQEAIQTRNREGGALGFIAGRPIRNPNYEAPE